MRIGVICEGPSDFPAIEMFFGHALAEVGIQSQFKALFPEIDRSRPEGGWSNVLLWLKNHPPEMRVQQYFGGGLFGGALSLEPLDVILIQLDSDILEDQSFVSYADQNYDFKFISSSDPGQRGFLIREIIKLASKFSEMSEADAARHVPSPAVESTETWCVAAFWPKQRDYEVLSASDLTTAFMTVLEKSEGKTPEDKYSNIDKSMKRRKKFCRIHATGSPRVIQSYPQFAEVVTNLVSLA